MSKNVFRTLRSLRRRGLLPTSSIQHYSTSANTVSSKNQNVFDENVEKYSVYQPTPISIAHFIDFGLKASSENSFTFLKREVPVRLANIMKELMLMPDELRKTRACKVVINQYLNSFQDIIAFENSNKKDPEVLRRFSETLFTIRERHANTVPSMAEAVMEVKSNYNEKDRPTKNGGQLPKFGKNIQYFLDRLYTSRISLRMLINQHTLLYAEPNQVSKKLVSSPDGRSKLMIGSLDPDCEVGEIVLQAYDNAKCLCEQYYMSAPELVYESHMVTKSKGPSVSKELQIGKVGSKNSGIQEPLHFVYVPSHLYHILFEIFKNAMRATIEHAGENALYLPPIEVFAVKGNEDVTIHVRDRGGGIPRRLMGHIFEYLYTTANPVITSSAEMDDYKISPPMMNTVPLAGYGYGLPLSRLYARYFGGDLEIYSSEGWGTDAVIYLHAFAGDAKERLPVYHETGSKKIYEAQLTASDWTGVSKGCDKHRKLR